MKRRTFIYLNLVAAIIAYLLWCWMVTIPASSAIPASASPHTMWTASAGASFKKSLPAKELIATSSTDLNNAAMMNHVEVPTQGTDAETRAPRHGDQSMPHEVYATVSLDQAEHYVLKQPTALLIEVSIRDYYQDARGVEWVDFHVWKNKSIAHITDARNRLSAFSPADQDYIRNWAKQQAAADPTSTSSSSAGWLTLGQLAQQANRMGISRGTRDWAAQVQAQLQANAAASAQTTPQQDAQAAEQPVPQQGPTIITN
jgi:hypothetical protein